MRAGAIVFSIIFEQLLPKIGFGWIVRVIAFIILVSLVLPIVVMKKRTAGSSRRALIDKEALSEVRFVLNLCVVLLSFLGLYIPFFYSVSTNVLDPKHEYLNNYLVIFLNVGSIFGRLVRFTAPLIPAANLLLLNSSAILNWC